MASKVRWFLGVTKIYLNLLKARLHKNHFDDIQVRSRIYSKFYYSVKQLIANKRKRVGCKTIFKQIWMNVSCWSSLTKNFIQNNCLLFLRRSIFITQKFVLDFYYAFDTIT